MQRRAAEDLEPIPLVRLPAAAEADVADATAVVRYSRELAAVVGTRFEYYPVASRHLRAWAWDRVILLDPEAGL